MNAASQPKGPPPLSVKPPTGKVQKAPAGAKTEAKPTRFYVVVGETMRVKTQHGDFLLRKGKEIRSEEYDVELLQRRGVKLREISTPGWFIEAQEKGRAKAQQLKDAGHDVEVPPEFVPITIDESPPAPAA